MINNFHLANKHNYADSATEHKSDAEANISCMRKEL